MIDVHYTSLISQGVQHREIIQTVTHPDINPIQKGLTLVNRQETVFPFCDSHTINLTFSILIKRLCEVNPGHSHAIIISIVIILLLSSLSMDDPHTDL